MRKILLKFIPAFIRKYRADYLYRQYQAKLKIQSPGEVFEYIYKRNIWGDEESVSGGGSNLQQTAHIINEIPTLLTKYNVKSLLDLPCGDFNWMQRIDLSNIDYKGGDIVADLIKRNQETYRNDGISFTVMDLLKDDLPEVDMILCRDCLIHLSNENVFKALKNLKRSKIKYLLTTSFVERKHNSDILTGEWRALNLSVHPFSIPFLDIINEKCTEGEGEYVDKSLVLIDLTALRANDQS